MDLRIHPFVVVDLLGLILMLTSTTGSFINRFKVEYHMDEVPVPCLVNAVLRSLPSSEV
jgi:hypothetical protein